MSTDPKELGQFLAGNEPAQTPDPGVAAPAPAPEPKLGDVLNDNAKLRAEIDAMRLEMQAARVQQSQPAAPVVTPQDEQSLWYNWVKEATNDARMAETLWLESPNEAFLRATAAVGRKMWAEVKKEAESAANRIGSAMRLDDRFEVRYPDLYEHRMGRLAVTQAIEEKKTDPGWRHLMGNMDTVPQALDQVADVAYKNLGVARPQKKAATPPPVSHRKGTGGEMGGVRPGEPPSPGDPNKGELSDMVRFMRGESS